VFNFWVWHSLIYCLKQSVQQRVLLLDLRQQRVEGVAHLVADGRVDDGQVFAFDLGDLVFDVEGHVLDFNHELVLLMNGFLVRYSLNLN